MVTPSRLDGCRTRPACCAVTRWDSAVPPPRIRAGLDPADDRIRLRRIRPRHRRRGHLPGLQLLDHLLPDLGRGGQRSGQGMGVEVQAGVLQHRVVAHLAVPGDEGRGGAVGGGGRVRGERAAPCEDEGQGQPRPPGSSGPSHPFDFDGGRRGVKPLVFCFPMKPLTSRPASLARSRPLCPPRKGTS